jgi:predicted GNAT family N-acyltransferase
VYLRESILRQPLGLKFSVEELENEKNHIQIVWFLNNEIIATVVLIPEGNICKMQRVVVKDSLQNQGIGSQLIRFCEDHARSLGFNAIYCHARDSAVAFYLNNHYIAEGGYFDEDTIPHLKMVKTLT